MKLHERKHERKRRSKFNRGFVTVFYLLFCFPFVSCSTESVEQVPEIRLPQGKADGLESVQPEDCPGGAPRLVNGRPAAWTIMVFQAGDNDLEDYLDKDVIQMEMGHNGTRQVNVLVQQDKLSEPGVWRWEVRNNNDSETIGSKLVGYSDQDSDTGDPQTLVGFGEWAALCYPAEYYMLIVSGHGTGWSGGDFQDEEDRRSAEGNGEPYRAIAYDWTSGNSLNIEDLAIALHIIADSVRREYDPPYMNRLVIYGSDACLMQTVEVVHALENPVTYVIGSEETEPAEGWPYSTILRELTARPFAYARAPNELARMIVEKYAESYGPYGGQGHHTGLTLSAVNLDYSRRLANSMTKVTSLLTELRVDSEPGEELDAYIWDARSKSPLYTDAYVDLPEFLMRLRADMIEAGLMPRRYQHWNGDERFRSLRNAIDETLDRLFTMIIANNEEISRVPDGKADGLSIYFPDWKYSRVLYLEDYQRSSFSQKTGWGIFLEELFETRYPGW